MMSHISSRWWRWKLEKILSLALLLMHIQESAVLGCQVDCTQVLVAAEGSFSSPCYPRDYPKNQACRWTLRAPAGFVVQITFLDFELEEALRCIYDRLVVNTGTNNVSFCGLTANGLSLNSTGNFMEVSFNSDFSVQKRGFNISYRQVAVALRNQKVTIPQSAGKTVKLLSHVTVPALTQFSICFEIARTSQKADETIFTYSEQNTVPISFGQSGSAGIELNVNSVNCPLGNALSASDFTSAMTPICLTWSSLSGNVGVYVNGNHKSVPCADSIGRSIKGGGTLQLGGKTSFDGFIYNFRMWNFSLTTSELKALTCDTLGNVIDWEYTFWDVQPAHVQTDSTLSCSSSLPSISPTVCPSPGLNCPEAEFHRITFDVTDEQGKMTEDMVTNTVKLWLNGSFEGWPDSFITVRVQPRPAADKSYTCQALLKSTLTDTTVKVDTMIRSKVVNYKKTLGEGLALENVTVQPVENCEAEHSPLSYKWSESKPTVTQFIPCFANKEQNASRTCMINWQNYTSFWGPADVSNCNIGHIVVSQENAAEVASDLAGMTNNNLSTEDVSMVVTKLKDIINVAKINSTLASTMVTIFSNVMTSSNTALATSSEMMLKMVDELVLKIEFEGTFLSITSKNLALGISAFNSSSFNGTSFSAYIPANSTDLQINFESSQQNSLATVTLPSKLLRNLSFGEADALSRINFMFFNNTGLFQDETNNSYFLNSYVVASSVGNHSINNLQDPVEIDIVHLQLKPAASVVKCVFWDFSFKNGSGGWNSEGCNVSQSKSTASRTVCLCYHLTHFGILMDISRSSELLSDKNNKALTFISYIGCGISAICSAATLFTYIAFEKLRRDYPSKILMNLSTSLLLLNMVFILDNWLAPVKAEGLCISMAAFLHFFLLTTFTWMGLESIHMYIALVKVFNTYIRRYILKFCLVGWGLPAAIVVIVVSVDRKYYGKLNYQKDDGEDSSQFCWVKDPVVFYVTCVGYFSIIFLMNVAMFIVVMIQICGRNGKRSNRTLREEVLRNLRSAVSLTFLLGMTWGFAFFAWGPVQLAFLYLFCIFNSLQGLFIFIFHCALKENVQKQWRRYLCCGRFRLADNSDWSKTATNNTKKVSSDNFGKSLSSCSFGSSTANWTSKAKLTFNPFTKRSSNAGKGYCGQGNAKVGQSEADTSSILPVHQVIDKVKGYCSARSDNFYKNIIMSDSFYDSTKF
ncbi:adhesion G-protein coupled receptor G6 isoform X2 [Brienomyrus brachyistius]|uniref:adhesion G-protein coupled receptor G6 isoform X2 n=1 Tax=Brienomyrus brachyistius TaxID=42636 RepID=UPI0020B1B351|nr:adhesion G-protein coupled receptor G6 isoform X2 [Brienomyrus brachyistius]